MAEFIEEYTENGKTYHKFKQGNAIVITEVIPEPPPPTGFEALSNQELLILIAKALNIPEPIA